MHQCVGTVYISSMRRNICKRENASSRQKKVHCVCDKEGKKFSLCHATPSILTTTVYVYVGLLCHVTQWRYTRKSVIENRDVVYLEAGKNKPMQIKSKGVESVSFYAVLRQKLRVCFPRVGGDREFALTNDVSLSSSCVH